MLKQPTENEFRDVHEMPVQRIKQAAPVKCKRPIINEPELTAINKQLSTSPTQPDTGLVYDDDDNECPTLHDLYKAELTGRKRGN